MFTKTVLALSAIIVLADSSAAFAMAKTSHHRTGARTALTRPVMAQTLRLSGVTSDTVFSGGNIIGRDPDPNVRLQLQRDYWSRDASGR